MNIAGNFLATAARLPDKPFLIGADGEGLSFAESRSRALKFARLLRDKSVKPGDRVILNFPNSLDYVCAYLGTMLNGCTALPVDFRSRPNHLEYVRTNADVALCVAPKKRPNFDGISDQMILPKNLDSLPELPLDHVSIDKNPLALIMYTSGSTGTPKGVCLTHANLQHTIGSITSWAQINENDRELTTLSLTHLFGMAHVHIYWTLGGTVYIREKLQDIPRLLDNLKAQRITSFPGTPAGFKMIIDQFGEQFSECGKNLKYIIVNSAPMDPEYVQKMLDLLPAVNFYMYYGLTEASRSSYIHYNERRDKLASVGQPTPGTEICVGTLDKPLVNKVGEILIRGPHVTEGYLGVDSEPFFVEGWLKTGDTGIIDEDGFLTWTGRIKEQINIDGLKLTPMEVEEVLMQHERVTDCAVVGVPDEMTGEKVIGFVVATGDPDKSLRIELRRFCKDRLEAYKIPRDIIFIDHIPRTDTGKAKRLSLKDQL